MKALNTNTLKHIGLLTVFAGLVGCGASKEAINNGSNLPSGPGLSGNTQALAKCSIDMDNHADFGMKLQAVDDGQFGLRSDLVRVRFIRIPSDFADNDQNALQLWTRTIDSSNNWGQWKTLRFYVEYRNSQGQMARTPYTYQDATWGTLKQIALSFGVTTTSASDFFGKFQLVAQLDAQGIAKTITAALYPENSNDVLDITALAPIFDASPTSYATTHPQALVDLHPLQALGGMSYSKEQFEFEAEKFCFM